MGKVKKIKNKKIVRHNPLHQEILENQYAKPSSRQKIKSRQSKDDEFVDYKLSDKILKQAREQQEDLEEEFGFSDSNSFKNASRLDSSTKEKTLDEELEQQNIDSNLCDSLVLEEIHITEEDEKAFEKFMHKEALADVIKEKLTEKQTEIYSVYSDTGSTFNEDLGKNASLYKALAPILKEYRSGKLPKAFKVIPQFRNWEQILYLTEPDKWSAATMLQASRIFSSNLKDKMAQRFYNMILLPRLRDDIAECKKLNFHLYQALIKALFKPAAFFKGIILPLCESGNCTLREATIFGSVLAKLSIPVLHSSAALLRIAEMSYTGASSIFMRVLLEKKYALPFRVVDAVVDHFLRFMNDKTEYPLLWHQCLLTFVQIYKNDLSADQKRGLLKLVTVHFHRHITPEIRRELHGFNTSLHNEECMADEGD